MLPILIVLGEAVLTGAAAGTSLALARKLDR